MNNKKIVILNQATNYLTIGICNEFVLAGYQVVLITGSVHSQGEELMAQVTVESIIKWQEEHGFKKGWIYLRALWSMWFKLLSKYNGYEVFFISVPPMAYLLNLFLPHRFSMLIWDIYPDGLKITGLKESHPLYLIWSRLNKLSFKKGYKLFTIGEEMAHLLSVYGGRNKWIVQPIWSIFQGNNKIPKEKNKFLKLHQLEDKFIIQYSGNIGLSHKVEKMVELAEQMQEHPNLLFQIIGRGPRKKVLEKLVEDKNLKNCQFLPFQSDDMFPHSLSAADVGIVILDEAVGKGSVPSKSYNLMSLGIPSIYIASEESELKKYSDTFHHAKCFTEKELSKAKEFVLKLYSDKSYYEKLSENNLEAATHFRRENAAVLVNKYMGE